MSFVARQAFSATRTACRSSRMLSSSSALRKDFVQDMYLKELKVYKPAPKAANDHVGFVKEYSAPATPQAPAVTDDLASELAAYDDTEPVPPSVGIPVEPGHAVKITGPETFLTDLETDKSKGTHH